MTELIDNSRMRRNLLKDLILQLHDGADPDVVRGQLVRLIGTIPYGDVVQVEQELIAEGLPQEEVLRLCDVHTAALRGQIDLTGMKPAPAGHPVHTFVEENRELRARIAACDALYLDIQSLGDGADPASALTGLRDAFRELWEVDKHYRRKENLLFPYLEKKGITGPPTVMWGKHDQIRALLKGALEALQGTSPMKANEAQALVTLLFRPATAAVSDMFMKEEQILFPMCMDQLTDSEWFDIAEQSPEIGFCLYDPEERWVPSDLGSEGRAQSPEGRIILPTGSMDLQELTSLLNTLPVDITFVDHTDTVRYFSQGAERIFDRNRSILGRKVQMCHPPHSVHVVNQIVADFRSGRQNRAEFWINLHGRFVYISYYAVRSEAGEYLGVLEMTMDATHLRTLEGERRLLSYEPAGETSHA